MKRSRRGWTFCLSAVAVLALMAVSAVGAQAAEFWVGSVGSFLLATLSGAQVGAGKLLVEKRGITITCQKGAVTSGALETKTSGKVTTEFKECTVLNYSDNKELAACTALEPIKAEATIFPGEHSTFKQIEVEESLITAIVISGAACASKGIYPVGGLISAKVIKNGAVVNEIEFSRTYSELIKDALKFGAFPAFIDATLKVELTGAHAGIKFGVA
jgi:hypothetical protein